MWDSAETGHLHCNTNGAAWEEANGLSDCRKAGQKTHCQTSHTSISDTSDNVLFMFGFLIPHSNHFSPHLREVQGQKCWKESGLASEQEAFAKSLNLKLIVLGMNIEVIQYPFNIMD